MRNFYHYCLIVIILLSPAATFAYGHYTVYSTVPSDVYLDNEYSATISATQSLKLILSGPQTYVIGVRARDTGQTYKESVTVGANLNEHREIRAFTGLQPAVTPVSPLLPTADLTVYSQIPAAVYIDNVLKASVDSTHPMSINLPGPRSYVIEVRATESNMVQREEVSVDPASDVKKEIRAFSDTPTATVVSTTAAAATPVAASTGGVTKAELASAIQTAKSQAKAEAAADEAGRRKRAGQRAVTNKGIAHVVGVEANGGLSSSVKNMERIKLLMEAVPSFGK